MPNFHMHWLVALQAIDSLDGTDDISVGRAKYLEQCAKFRDNVYSAVRQARGITTLPKTIQTLAADLERGLRHASRYDAITCFSAYMLGACGPDFWTLMSNETLFPSAEHTAGLHFDLGHYNRTHQQFVVSGNRLRRKATKDLTDRVERAYFAGMATHVATDLVLHELVNVYAGAYNILDKAWGNEHGTIATVPNLWSTHNKVEHYWDTYVRYRWLGDYGPVWSPDEVRGGPRPLGLPLGESLLREARRLGKDIEVLLAGDFETPDVTISLNEVMGASASVEAGLAGPAYHVAEGREDTDEVRSSKQFKENQRATFKTKTTYLLERPMIFPRVFCDRMLARDGLRPFIHEVVVKDGGAYPSGDLFAEAIAEKTSAQMNDVLNGGLSEGNKLRTFSSRVNMGDGFSSFNFQAYFMCPDLQRLKEYGPTVFWEPKALPDFIRTATQVAAKFAAAYMDFADGWADDIDVLANFWNLDTGLGLQVQNVSTQSSRETRTRLKFVHVTEATRTRIEHDRKNEHLDRKKKHATYDIPGRYKYERSAPAFDVHVGGPFADSQDIHEPASSRYLRALVTEGEVGPRMSSLSLDEFFARPGTRRPPRSVPVPTDGVRVGTKVVAPRRIASRLSLEFEAAIAQLGGRDVTGFALYGDRQGKTAEPQKQEEHACKEWLDAEVSQCLRVIEPGAAADVRAERGLVFYTGRVFANFDPASAPFTSRQTGPGRWNNVVDPQEVTKYCGKNFAVATLRTNVLKQTGDGRFWADKDFRVFTDLTPTEQIFFTLFPIVSTYDGCYDLFTKATVSRGDFEAMRKIRCLGFVPIVLLYAEEHDGYAQLQRCYVDGLEVPVTQVSE